MKNIVNEIQFRATNALHEAVRLGKIDGFYLAVPVTQCHTEQPVSSPKRFSVACDANVSRDGRPSESPVPRIVGYGETQSDAEEDFLSGLKSLIAGK